jgi:D-serine deaminase-like pyridoxal phosphate-dependent protein
MLVSDLDTPAILIDEQKMERNLERAAEYARRHGLRLRPHTKTHKSTVLGRRQLELGAAGLAVAKTTEAEVMMGTGTPDLLVIYPVVGPQKLRRLTELARRTRVTVSVDSLEAALPISEAARAAGVEIDLLAELDAGLHRVGAAPGEALYALVDALVRLPATRWRGIAFYPGHLKSATCSLDGLCALISRTVSELSGRGHAPEIVSGGSTPLLWQSHLIAGMNEIRPGTYIFNDRNTVQSGACTVDDCAATILTTVVSVAPGRMIIDGGSKTFSSDRLSADGEVTFGELVEAPGAVFHKMNEEHGYVDLPAGSPAFKVGDRVRVIPNHICVAVNLHERLYLVRGDEVISTLNVEARGKLQ